MLTEFEYIPLIKVVGIKFPFYDVTSNLHSNRAKNEYAPLINPISLIKAVGIKFSRHMKQVYRFSA